MISAAPRSAADFFVSREVWALQSLDSKPMRPAKSLVSHSLDELAVKIDEC